MDSFEDHQISSGSWTSVSEEHCANCQSKLLSNASEQWVAKQVIGLDGAALFKHEDLEEVKLLKALSRIFLPPLWDKENFDCNLDSKNRPWSERDACSLAFCQNCCNLISVVYRSFRELVFYSKGRSYVLEKLKLYLTNSKGLVNHCKKNVKDSRTGDSEKAMTAGNVGFSLGLSENISSDDSNLCRSSTLGEATVPIVVPKVEVDLFEEPENYEEYDGFINYQNNISKPHQNVLVSESNIIENKQPIQERRISTRKKKASLKKLLSRSKTPPPKAFYCPVCNVKNKSSNELFQHFIQYHDILTRQLNRSSSFNEQKALIPGEESQVSSNINDNFDDDWMGDVGNGLSDGNNEDANNALDPESSNTDIKLEDTMIRGLEPYVSENEARFKLVQKFTTMPNPLDVNKLTCTLCGEIIERRYSYQHMTNFHQTEFNVNYYCESCGAGFLSPVGLRNHAPFHDRGGFACEECGKHFMFSERMKYHVKTDHEEKEFLCTTCGKNFYSTDLLNGHVGRRHGLDGTSKYYFDKNGEKVKCHICPFEDCRKLFFKKGRLTDHQNGVHKKLKPNQCPHRGCSKSFVKRANLRKHFKRDHKKNLPIPVRSKIKKENLKTEKVSKKVITVKDIENAEKGRILKALTCPVSEQEDIGDRYDTNLESETQKTLVRCKLCGKLSKGKGMINHLIRKHNDECDLKHLCDICGRGCLSRETLYEHTKRHTDINKFSCSKCDKSFNDKRLLDYHIASIHENTKHVCSTCGRTFKLKFQLTKHNKSPCKIAISENSSSIDNRHKSIFDYPPKKDYGSVKASVKGETCQTEIVQDINASIVSTINIDQDVHESFTPQEQLIPDVTTANSFSQHSQSNTILSYFPNFTYDSSYRRN